MFFHRKRPAPIIAELSHEWGDVDDVLHECALNLCTSFYKHPELLFTMIRIFNELLEGNDEPYVQLSNTIISLRQEETKLRM
jgi:hypothetical protein